MPCLKHRMKMCICLSGIFALITVMSTIPSTFARYSIQTDVIGRAIYSAEFSVEKFETASEESWGENIVMSPLGAEQSEMLPETPTTFEEPAETDDISLLGKEQGEIPSETLTNVDEAEIINEIPQFEEVKSEAPQEELPYFYRTRTFTLTASGSASGFFAVTYSGNTYYSGIVEPGQSVSFTVLDNEYADFLEVEARWGIPPVGEKTLDDLQNVFFDELDELIAEYCAERQLQSIPQ